MSKKVTQEQLVRRIRSFNSRKDITTAGLHETVKVNNIHYYEEKDHYIVNLHAHIPEAKALGMQILNDKKIDVQERANTFTNYNLTLTVWDEDKLPAEGSFIDIIVAMSDEDTETFGKKVLQVKSWSKMKAQASVKTDGIDLDAFSNLLVDETVEAEVPTVG